MKQNSNDCSSPGFKALMVTQFLGALNDNLFKLLVSLIILADLVEHGGGTLELSLTQALFVLPFILFSSYAGTLADRYSKTMILQLAKVMEVLVMILGFYFLSTRGIAGLMVVLFLMGVHSALFSPAKYGILPEILDEAELSSGNGYLEMWTFLAIIGGMTVSGVVSALSVKYPHAPGLSVLLVSIVGFVSSFFITKVPAQAPDKRINLDPFHDSLAALKEIRRDKDLWLTMLAIAYFWAVGAFFQLNILIYAKQLLELTESQTAFLIAVFGVGIGVGSVVAGAVSRGKVELGLVPIGALGIGVFGVWLCFSYTSLPLTLVVLFCFGVSGGLFSVPLNAFFQRSSPELERGRFLGAMNLMSFSWMLIAAGLMYLLRDGLKFSPAQLFFGVGVLSVFVGAYVCHYMPRMALRCLNWLLANLFFRTRTFGIENVPKTGGALIVCNHVSYVDPPLLLAATERPIRFLMYRPIYEAAIIRPIAKLIQAIPIAPEDGPKEIIRALNEARTAILNGELVCIFAEGQLTRTGNLLAFGKGFEKIMKGITAPIIPVYLDQIWGSIFSFRDGKFFRKIPKEIPYPVTLRFGAPLPSDTKSPEVRRRIQELGAEAFKFRLKRHQLLHAGFLDVAKRKATKLAVSDSSGASLRYLPLLSAALNLSTEIRRTSSAGAVGILLPPSVAAVVANLGVLFAGKFPVNLNYTAAKESLRSAIKQCEITQIITSRAFIEKAGIELLPEMTPVEDFSFLRSKKRKALYLAIACLPVCILERLYLNRTPSGDDIATVIFSSGSTGEPKGVVLTHSNISSNIESLYELFRLNRKDCVVGVLPFFHAFGFTGTVWLPLLGGISAVYHPNPLDAAAVGDLTERYHGSILLATPTFLLGYLRRCTKEQFQTLRYVIVGAEKLKSRLREAFQEKFGVTPLEGYGCTELSPVAMLNIPDVRDRHIRQTGQKAGTVGHPVPGVAAQVVNPESFEPLAPDTPGLLLIKGGNVMAGYLKNPEKTKEVIHDGWYVTGDIAQIDEDGFVTVTDRLSRFSKIGGEMVPHIKVEEEIQKVLGTADPVAAVTGVPDEKKGEKLVVLLAKEFDAAKILEGLSKAGLPNLWIPKRENFFRVDSLPILGTGKTDLKAIKQLALNLAAERSEAS